MANNAQQREPEGETVYYAEEDLGADDNVDEARE
jgi:hypothetical protein